MPIYVRTGCLRITAEEQSRRCIRKDLADRASRKGRRVEMAAAVIPVGCRGIWLPAQSKAQGQVGPEAIRVLAVNAPVALSPVFLLVVSLTELVHGAQHKVG